MTVRRSTKTVGGQIHLNETFLVLFLVVILLFLGIIFYGKFLTKTIEGRAEVLSERESTLFLARFTSLAEVRCSQEACLDTGKFLPFQALAEGRYQAFYRGLFGYQKITVEQLYPAAVTQTLCTPSLYQHGDYPTTCSRWLLYAYQPASLKGTQKLSSIVSLYYPETDTYSIGRVTLEVYV